MAGQYLSLGEVKSQAIYRADLEGISDRHPSLSLGVEANASFRRLRLKLANANVMHVLTATALATLPTTEPFTNAGWVEIDWPTDAASIHGVDVLVNGDWGALNQGDLANRRRASGLRRDRGPFGPDLDSFWVPKSLPNASGAVPTVGKIMLFPVPQQGQYILWYLQHWLDIMLDTDVFPAQEGWIDWVSWDLACTALIRDTGPQTSAQLEHCVAARERCWQEIKGSAVRLANDGPIEVPSRYSRSSSTPRMVP